MKLVIVDLGVGNVCSVANMINKISAKSLIIDSLADVPSADAIILPGVGSYDAAVGRLRQGGIAAALDAKARDGTTPILGICLGMQLMGDRSEEGKLPGFGWIGGELKRFKPADGGDRRIRVPRMGWNVVAPQPGDPLYAELDAEPRFYFDHSYYFIPRDRAASAAVARHGVEFCAGIRRDCLFGVQFHPEKSHRFGFQLLKNFVAIAGERAGP